MDPEKISDRSSEAPLMTLGCSMKPGSDATKPTTLTIWVTRSRFPIWALMAARALRVHMAAWSFATSPLTVVPTLPVIVSLPWIEGSCPEV